MKNPEHYKKSPVGLMFDNIAFRYDFLNHFLSFGVDRIWRRKAIRAIPRTCSQPEIIDVATGTGDLAIEALKLDPVNVTGIDISEGMLRIAGEKVNRKDLSEKIRLIRGGAENIPFSENRFDIAMVAFGVRNFSDVLKGLEEMLRVLRKGGSVMILEFSKPAWFPFKQIYTLYFLHVLPFAGRLLSGNRHAYRYLPESVLQFPDGEEFLDLMRKAGFKDLRIKRFTGGITTVYTGLKL
jgi:demethylmenaquinone methyltransferase/2-methoxy-6-polyprenyl-1,4-benzoquinol methylase